MTFLFFFTTEELSDLLNLKYEIVEGVMSIILDKISMDAPIPNKEETSLYDFIPNDDSLNPETYLNKSSIRNGIERLLAGLNDRDSGIMRSLYGLDGNEPLSLSEIAFIYGLSQGRIRQIKEGAIKKLKTQNHNKSVFKEYMYA